MHVCVLRVQAFLIGCGYSTILQKKMTTHHFHSRCGKNIRLSDNNTVAERVRSWANGIVFTEQPVALGTVFRVKILDYCPKLGGSIVSG